MYMLLPARAQKLDTAELALSSPALKSAGSRNIAPEPERETPVAQSSPSRQAAPVQNAGASGLSHAVPSAADLSTNATSDADSSRIIVKPLAAQTSSPLEAASEPAIDKSVPPPMPDGIAIANSVLQSNPVLVSQARTPASAGSRALVPSVLISQVSPDYPELAVRSRISGSVVLELHINKEGKVIEATPVSGPSVFYSEAVKAAMQYRYRPATLDGTNMSSKSRVTMVFNLNR
jgi:TonB family protein